MDSSFVKAQEEKVWYNNKKENIVQEKLTPSIAHHLSFYRVFFLLVLPQKVLSVEDGKIPTKKVKVGLFKNKMWSFTLPDSTQQVAEKPVKKTHCITRFNADKWEFDSSFVKA